MLLVSTSSYAQSDVKDSSKEDYGKLYEKAVKENMDLSSHKKYIEKFLQTSKATEKTLLDSIEDLHKDSIDIAKKIEKIKTNKNYMKYCDLIKKRDSLNIAISRNDSLLCVLTSELKSIDSSLSTVNMKKSEIDKFKNEFCQNLINQNKTVLEKPFSQMTIKELNTARQNCSQYTIDQSVNAFVAKIDTTITSKKQYDEIVNVLNSPYNALEITKAQQLASKIICNSEAQKSEIATIRKQLPLFKPGIDALKKFVTLVNDNRNGRSYYSYTDDFEPIKEIMLIKNGLSDLEARMNGVPYLKNAYSKFMTEFRETPSKHSAIETEILNQ